MSISKILLGVGAMFAVNMAIGKLLAAMGVEGLAQHMTAFFFAAFAGGWIARKRFMLAAIGYWAVAWCVVIYILYSIALPTGQASLRGIIGFNVLPIAFTYGAVFVGAGLGQMLATWRHSRASATAT